MSTTETASGVRPSTALDTRFVIATTLGADNRVPGRRPTSTLALAARVGEYGILGQCHVNACLLDVGDRHDRSFQLAFQRSPIVHMLGEIGNSEIRFVEDLESDASGFGQPQSGHFEAQFRDFVLGRQQLGSIVRDSVVHSAFMHLLDDGAGVFGRQSGIERPHSAFAFPMRGVS
jgi:hypothetical protein